MIYSKSGSRVSEDAIAAIENDTGLDVASPESRTRMLVSPLLTEIGNLWGSMLTLDRSYRLQTAYGAALDTLGELVGVTRRSELSGLSSPFGMQFYLLTAAAEAITIPANTRVWSNDDQQTYCLTNESTTIPVGGLEAYASIRVANNLQGYAAAPRTLTNHSGPQSVYCTNVDSIATALEEDDASYRYRIARARSTYRYFGHDALVAHALEVPGVLSAEVREFRRGAGTADIIVYTVEPVTSPALLLRIQSHVTQFAPIGLSVEVLAPTVVYIDLVVRLGLDESYDAQSRAHARMAVGGDLRSFINTRELGEGFSLSELRQAALGESEGPSDVIFTSMSIDGVEIVPTSITVGDESRLVARRIEVL